MNTIVKGYVVDKDGKPLSKVKVNLTAPTGESSPLPTYKLSDASIVTFERLPDNKISAILSSIRRVTLKGKAAFQVTSKELLEEIIKEYEKTFNLKEGTITYTLISEGGKYKNIDTTVTTDKNGEWSFKYPTTDLNALQSTLVFSKNLYELKTVTNLLTTLIDNNGDTIINVSRISLNPLPKFGKPEINKVINDVTSAEVKITAKQLNLFIPFEARLVNLLNKKKEQLKRTLIPFILKLLLPFGSASLQGLLAKLPQSEINKLVNCPSKAEIQRLINKRNKLVKQINNIYKTVKILTVALVGANIVITALQIGLLSIAFIPPPIPGAVPVAVDKLSLLLKKAGVVVDALTITAATFGAFLAVILDYLSKFDILLQSCTQKIIETDPEFEIFLESISDEITALSSATSVALQENGPNAINTYKGFKLEVKIDESNDSKFTKRYAQALTTQGVAVLRTESSFASDPQVLLDQLRFIIDSNPNLTAQ